MRARDNPFRVDRVLQVRFEPQEMSWDELWRRVREMRFRGAIVGPEGSGKTTLLEDLAPRLAGEGFETILLRLNQENRTLDNDVLRRRELQRCAILLDGADQLVRRAWKGFLRDTASAGGVIVTSHRQGLMPAICQCRTSPRLLGQIIRRLTEDMPVMSKADIEALWQHHGGNVRDALRELYDRAAESHRGTGLQPNGVKL